MITNKLQQDIISLFDSDFKACYSINRISQHLRKAYPYINKKVNQLIAEGILQQTVIGRSHLCSLNLKNPKTRALLALQEVCKQEAALARNKPMQKTTLSLELLKQHTDILTVFVNSHSLVIVLQELSLKKSVENHLLSLPGFQRTFLDKALFLELVLKERQVLQDHIILYGFEKYYELISEVDERLPPSFERE